MRRLLASAAIAAVTLAACGSSHETVRAGEAGTAPAATILPGARTCADLATTDKPVLNSTDGSCTEGQTYRFAVGYSFTGDQCANGPGGVIVINGDMWWLNGKRQTGPPPAADSAETLYELVCGHP